MTAPEFSRTERIDQIGERPRDVAISADDAEQAALAERFGLLGLERLEARFSLRRDGTTMFVEGVVLAAATQACVATGEPVPATIEVPVSLRFVPEMAGGDEIEIDAGELDSIGYSGGAIDLGEAAADTLALALDPFPRSPGAEAALREAGVLSEEEAAARASPFAALKGLTAGK